MSGSQVSEPQVIVCTNCGKDNRATSKFCMFCGKSLSVALVPTMSSDDLNLLKMAKLRLEHPNLAARIADVIGKPVESLLTALPEGAQDRISDATQKALYKGLEYAISTIGDPNPKASQDRLHQLLVAGTGALGGVAGLWSVLIELPVSTCLMLRSIADIARSEGHDIAQVGTQLACLEVFALGGKSAQDDQAETGYWAVRFALAAAVNEAATYLARRGAIAEGAPQLVRLISVIAARFSVIVTEEVVAKAIPVVGAVSGGLINVAFMNHFQEMARGHFTIKRLEAQYGTDVVQQKYRECVI